MPPETEAASVPLSNVWKGELMLYGHMEWRHFPSPAPVPSTGAEPHSLVVGSHFLPTKRSETLTPLVHYHKVPVLSWKHI